ncbi:MAG: o-succinylbenzoate--CoA ligase [Actinomycetes bacterium]
MPTADSSRPLVPMPTPSGPAVLDAVLPALAAALDGSGPAVVPVPEGPQHEAVLAMARLDEPVENDAVTGEAAALVVPTSGSTGVPKGALLTASALRASGTATLDRLGGPGTWVLALPVTHIAGLQVVARSLLTGTPLLPLPLTAGFDVGVFVTETAKARAEAQRLYTALVPTQLRRLLDDNHGREALASYDGVLVGGAATPADLLVAARAAGATLVTTYGMSETAGGCVYDGVPLEGVSVDLAVDGRIALGGPTVFLGYRGRPDLTQEALEVRDDRRWHLTKDWGRWREGRLDVRGRLDDVIVTGGENVAPLAVEQALATLPWISECIVVGAPDDEWGQRVCALVVARDDAPEDPLAAARDALRSVVPSAALPREVLLVDRLPLLDSGKPDRRSALGMARQPTTASNTARTTFGT